VRDAPNQLTLCCSELTQHLQSYFNDIKDPRVERTRAHLLTDILMISILAVMAGAQGWEDIETYGLSKQVVGSFALPASCADTFRRVFAQPTRLCCASGQGRW